jgi:ABC-type polysaccharide/polyol phosphate export permease
MTVALTDMIVSFAVLASLFVIYTTMPQPQTIFVIPLFAIQLLYTATVAIVLSGVSVHVRDVRNLVPMALSMMMFVTPVAYSFDEIPGNFRWLYSIVSPMGPILDGYRQCILYGEQPNWGYIGLALASTLVTFVGGMWLFKKLETTFADVA